MGGRGTRLPPRNPGGIKSAPAARAAEPCRNWRRFGPAWSSHMNPPSGALVSCGQNRNTVKRWQRRDVAGQPRSGLSNEVRGTVHHPPGPDSRRSDFLAAALVGVGHVLFGRDAGADLATLGAVRVVVPVDALLTPEPFLHLGTVQAVQALVGEVGLRGHR